MKTKIIFLILFISMICYFFLSFLIIDIYADSKIENNKIIAKYRNIPIYRKQIEISKRRILNEYSKNEKAVIITHLQRLKLRNVVENIIVSYWVKKLGIKVSADEIEKEKEKLMKNIYDGADKNYLEKFYTKLIELLEVYVFDHAKGEKLYREKYSNEIDYDKWNEYKKIYNTPKKLEKFKKDLSKFSIDFIKKEFENIAKKKLIKEKLIERLVAEGEIENSKEFYLWLHKETRNLKVFQGDLLGLYINYKLPFIEKIKSKYRKKEKRRKNSETSKKKDKKIKPYTVGKR